MIPLLLIALGTVIAFGAHLGARKAKRRSQERYEEIMAPLRPTSAGDLEKDTAFLQESSNRQNIKIHPRFGVLPRLDLWEEVRSVVGGWGCLLIALEGFRALGIVLAAGGLVYGLALLLE